MPGPSPIPAERFLAPEKMARAIKIFKAKNIPVYEPGEDNYERYVATSNLIYRFSSPPCVVQPKCACDVRDIIKIANPLDIPITIKNGGHSYAGGSTTNVGILMELGLMNEVNLEPNSGTVTVKGGALWFHVYKKLVNKHLDGWVVNGGRCPTVGVSGFMLGGGLSPFTRSFGMGCDTVKEFTIVTATGDEVTVSEDNHGDKNKDNLFWALRGAGGGNFGVVVEMKLYLQKLKSDLVVAGRYTWHPEKDDTSMNNFMATMNSFYKRKWTNEMTIDSSWLCDVKETKSDIAVRFLVYYNGGRPNFNREIDAWDIPNNPSQAKLKEQLKTRSLQEPSSRFLHETLAAQWVEETKKAMPTNRVYQIYTSFVFQNSDKEFPGIINTIREEMKKFKEQFQGETALMQVTFIHSGGAANDKKREDMAFRWRRSIYHTYIMLQWDEKWLEEPMRRFLGEMKPRLSKFGMVKFATFINFPDDTLKPEVHEQAYYGNNRKKLRDIKQHWDPRNYFKWSQGIRLPAEAAQSSVNVPSSGGETNTNLRYDQALIDEAALTDLIALQQWRSFRPPSSADYYGGGALPSLVN